MGRRRKYRRFSPEFKAEAVRLVTTTEEPIAKIAQELGVATQNLRAWVQAARPQARAPLTELPATRTFRNTLPSGWLWPVMRGSTAPKSLPASRTIAKQQGTERLGLTK